MNSCNSVMSGTETCCPLLEDKTTEEDLLALDRFLQCREDPASSTRTTGISSIGKFTAVEIEDEDDEARQKRYFQQQLAKVKAQYSQNTFEEDSFEAHSFINLIKSKFQIHEQDHAVLDAWSTDFQLSNNQLPPQANPITTVELEGNEVEQNEGDLLVDELLDGDEEMLNQTTSSYSWRFDEAGLDLKVDNFVEESDDIDFSSAYLPSSWSTATAVVAEEDVVVGAAGVVADAADAAAGGPVPDDIETLVFEESDVDNDDEDAAEGVYNLQDVLAMMSRLGGPHEQQRLLSIAKALQQGGVSYAEMDIKEDNGEVRFFTEVEAFDDDEEEEQQQLQDEEEEAMSASSQVVVEEEMP